MKLPLLHVLPLYKLGIMVLIESIQTWWLIRLLSGIIGCDVCFKLKPDTDLDGDLLDCLSLPSVKLDTSADRTLLSLNHSLPLSSSLQTFIDMHNT